MPAAREDREWVRSFAPASVSNVTCGFDLIGFAVEGWGDEVEARATAAPGVHLETVTGDGGRLPLEPDRNTAGVAALHLLERCGGAASDRGVELRLHKGLPLASGLGSSAASGVAAALAVNRVLDLAAGRDDLLAAAVEGERIACGTPHPDNAAPSLCGGLLLVRAGAAPAITHLNVPRGLTAVLLHPHAEVATEAARAALPATVSLATAVTQAGNLAALVAGLLDEDFELIESAMFDLIAEPVRAPMTPGFDSMRRAAREAGALGCGLSGSGPTVFAWCRSPEEAAEVEPAMVRALEVDAGLGGDSRICAVGAPGARILASGETSSTGIGRAGGDGQ